MKTSSLLFFTLLALASCSPKATPFPKDEKAVNTNDFIYDKQDKVISKNALEKATWNVKYQFYSVNAISQSDDLKFFYLLANSDKITLTGDQNTINSVKAFLIDNGFSNQNFFLVNTNNHSLFFEITLLKAKSKT